MTGDIVEVHGLTTDAGLTLNGFRGKLLSHDGATGRWCVKFDAGSTSKKIKECNLTPCQALNTATQHLVDQLLHYGMPFDTTSPNRHGCWCVETAITLFYNGYVIVYCMTRADQRMVEAHLQSVARADGSTWMKEGRPRYAVITDKTIVPFEKSQINTLINFKVPSLVEYERRIQSLFYSGNDWPRSEPKGLVLNVIQSSLSPPYTSVKLDTRDWGPLGGSGYAPFVSVFREDHPECLHDHDANCFDKSIECKALKAGGIVFKPLGDEACAGANIEQWHLMLHHHPGKRTFVYLKDWSWSGSPPDRHADNPTVSMSMADILNPFSSAMMELDRGFSERIIRIPPNLTAGQALDLIRRHSS